MQVSSLETQAGLKAREGKNTVQYIDLYVRPFLNAVDSSHGHFFLSSNDKK